MKPNDARQAPARRGLTRGEIVALGIAAMLLTTLLIAPRGRFRGEVHSICGTNLAGIGKALTIYAAQNDDRIPIFPGAAGTRWLCDESPQFRAAVASIASAGAGGPPPKTLFYCPSNTAQDPAKMSSWNSIAVTGYTFFNDRGPDAKNMPQDFPKTNPPLAYQSQIPSTFPSDTLIAADWIISSAADAKNTGETKVRRPGSPPLFFSTSHLASPTKASGANVLAADNSVRWRNFTPAKSAAIKQPGPAQIYFWIPNE